LAAAITDGVPRMVKTNLAKTAGEFGKNWAWPFWWHAGRQLEADCANG
jgi:hypothetical protein